MKKPSLRVSEGAPAQQVAERQQRLIDVSAPGVDYSSLFAHSLNLETVSQKNCENLIGSVEVPVGVAGPLLVMGEDWQDEVYVPLATTEGALVASVSRGCKVLSESGGVRVFTRDAGMTRAPVFTCQSGAAALEFQSWIDGHINEIAQSAENTSSHLHFLHHHSWVRGRQVYVRFALDTGEAMGMNMVTIGLQAALNEVLAKNPQVVLTALSSNVCIDKKDSFINSILGRGWWVQAEAFLSHEIIATVLKTSAEKLQQVHIQKNLVGSNLAGSLSQNAQVANILAALYIATGQDPAHVVEGSKAFLSVEPEEKGLYIALTLPNIQIGTVGGGTGLEQQTQARSVIRSGEKISSAQLSAVAGAAALAGEISLLAALAEHQLSAAHQKLGRNQICALV